MSELTHRLPSERGAGQKGTIMPTLWERITRCFKHKSVPPKPSKETRSQDSALPGAVILAEGMPLPPGEVILSLFTPDGESIPNPSEDVLRKLLFEMNWAEVWGDDGMITYAWFLHTPSGRLVFSSVPNKPELFFFRREPYGFYFIYRDLNEREYVPDNGSASLETVCHGLGGNSYQFATTGFVPPTTALAILQEFTHSGRRDPSVKWVVAPPLTS